MKTLSLQLPDEADEKEVKMGVAAVLFDKGLLSSGQAAALADVTKREFIEAVGLHGVSVFGETALDLKTNIID